jgi:nucleotide-binding universal stress UspA family protein
MKSILLPVEPHDRMPAAMETAWLLAERFGASVDGVALRPSLVDFVVPDPMGALVVQPPPHDESEATARAHREFDRFASTRTAAAGAVCPAFRWRGGVTVDDATLGSLGRLYDATVVGRPGTGRNDPRMTSLESALFESGRPIIVAPPQPGRTLGKSALIHWNASTETARVIAFALPLLKMAEKVAIIVIEGAVQPGPSAAELAESLRAHGITATVTTSRPGSRNPGEVILDHARQLGCDLLVKGAYTQSRLKQMIFGGATNHILSYTHIPTIMAH